MTDVLRRLPGTVTDARGTHRAQVLARQRGDGSWEGWLEFLPVDGDTSRNLRLTVEILTDLQDQVREDSRAKIRTMGLLGDKTLDISVGTPRYAVLQDGDTLLTSPSLDYDCRLFGSPPLPELSSH